MAKNRTEEDWFLRGGERPEQEPEEKTVFCPSCGGENLSDEEFCTHCGQPIVVEPRFERDHMNRFACQNCGKPYLDGAKFCPHCGAALDRTPDSEDDETDEVEYDVSMVRTKTVRQRCRVTVAADCEESAMEKAEELAEDESDDWPWEDEDNSTEYEDCEAESAEEL